MSVEKPWLPHARAARIAAGWALVFLVAGLGFAGFLDGNDALAARIVGTIFCGMLLLVAGIIALVARAHRRQLARLLSEAPLVHWRYGPEQWARHVARSRRRIRRLTPIFTGLFGLSGGLFGALLLFEDGVKLAGVPALTVLVPTAIGAAGGAVLGLTIRAGAAATIRRMAESPGEAWIGGAGVYLPGMYWPWGQFGAWFEGASLERDGEDLLVALRFRVATRGGSTEQKVLVPVPPGEEETAARVTGLLSPGGAGADPTQT